MGKMEITFLYKKRDMLFHRRWRWDRGSYPAKWRRKKFMVYYRNMGFIEIKRVVLEEKMIHKLKGIHATREVWLDGKKLFPERSQKAWNHSPDGFSWGYGGSGPAQLALAICLEILDDEGKAVKCHQQFKWAVIAKLPQSDFEITFESLLDRLKEDLKIRFSPFFFNHFPD